MDLMCLALLGRAGMRVAEHGLLRMASAARPTSNDTTARAGFTVMELMIVLVIIGVMAMTVAPSLSDVLTNNRQASAAMDLVKFGRQIRSRSISSGVAQLMIYRSADSNGLGRIELFPSVNNRCRQSELAWKTGFDKGVLKPVRALSYDMLDYNPGTNPTATDTGRPVIKLLAKANDDLSELWLCYQPDGLVYASYLAGDPLRVQDIDVEFTIQRKVNGVIQGYDRKAVFPMGGNARLQ